VIKEVKYLLLNVGTTKKSFTVFAIRDSRLATERVTGESQLFRITQQVVSVLKKLVVLEEGKGTAPHQAFKHTVRTQTSTVVRNKTKLRKRHHFVS
jgi:hypothetical protein